MSNKIDHVEWMAKKLYLDVSEENRPKFLHALKYNRDHVEEVTANNVEELTLLYVMEVGDSVLMNADIGDQNVFATYARKIVDYLCDYLLKEKIAAI